MTASLVRFPVERTRPGRADAPATFGALALAPRPAEEAGADVPVPSFPTKNRHAKVLPFPPGGSTSTGNQVGSGPTNHTDGIGSTRFLTDASGAVSDQFAYDAFGTTLWRTGTTLTNYLYVGEQFDPNLGFVYLRARYLDVGSGRFVSQDPFGGSAFDPISLHRYLYVSNDPANRPDPSGQSWLMQTLVTSAIVGVLAGGLNYARTGDALESFKVGGEVFIVGVATGGALSGLQVLAMRAGIIAAAAPTAQVAMTALRLRGGTLILLEEGQMVQLIIRGNEVVGFSTRIIMHDALAAKLGYSAAEVVGATAIKQSGTGVIHVFPSGSVTGASAAVLEQVLKIVR